MMKGALNAEQALPGTIIPRGNDGISPVVAVTQTDAGYNVEITDIYGTKSFFLSHGAPGEPGEPGEPGKDGADGAQGADGQPGADGYTPVKGVDYFTEADKQEIAEQAAQMVDVSNVVKTINGVAPDKNGNVVVDGGSVDMSSTASTLLITILRNGVYSTDQSANITALENALASGGSGGDTGGGDDGDEPVVTTYTITNTLSNATSNNTAVSVEEGASYTATLTAAEGYELDSVTVLMGEVDVTADVYVDGVITIPAVTGDVEIVASAVEVQAEPELITDGLLGYWDMRNMTEPVTANWHWAYPSNVGDGGLYASLQGGSKGTSEPPTSNEYGTASVFSVMPDAATYPGSAGLANFGTEFTLIILSHGAAPAANNNDMRNGIVGSNVGSRWKFQTNYYKTDGTTATTEDYGNGNADSVADYNFLVKRVNGSDMKVIFDTSEHNYSGADYDDFDCWNPTVLIGTLYNAGTVTAFAIYNRALTDVEIEEARVFFETLEVTA